MTRQISVAVISLRGVLAFGAPSFAQSGSGGSGGAHSSGSSGGGTQQGQREMFEQQRSDKTQQGQQLINEQPMQQQSGVQGRKQTQTQQADISNTGADLTGGRRDGGDGPMDEVLGVAVGDDERQLDRAGRR